MSDFMIWLFGSRFWEPHGHCFLWEPPLLWLLVGANILIALAYFSIPFALTVLIRKRRDLIHRWVFWAFAAFILGCGLTHAVRVWTIWQPVYWLQGGVDALTAVASVATAVALWPLLPNVLSLPSPGQLQRTIDRLETEIEERKRVEAALRQSEARFRRLLESAPDGVVVTDRDGVIQLVNSQAENLFGYPRDEMLGEPVEMLVPAGKETAHQTHRQRYMEEPVTRPMGVDLDLYAMRKDGSRIPVEISLSPLESSGELAIMSIVRDVSERRRIQQNVSKLNDELQRQNKQLEEANDELESFTYSVSHDLRAPLRAMNGYSRILVEDYADSLDPKAANYLNRIQLNTAQMGNLIDDLLAFSRLSRQEIKTQTVQPDRLVERLLPEVLEPYDERQIDVELHELPPCEGDPNLLRQVFINLIDNAIKYTRERDTAHIEIGSQTRDGRIVYYVRDNGIGFDEQYSDKLFGVFQRLHRAEEYEGTGVGLATVERIVHRHGGQVWAEGEPGGGATFYFSLGGDEEDGDEPADGG